MKFFSENGEYINADCEFCGKTIKIKRQYAVPSGSGFIINPPTGIKCPCGQVHHKIDAGGGAAPIRCPKCQSTQLTAGNQGFGLGKAVAGTVLLGPLGALGGFWGSRTVKITCLACGHKWEPGNR